MSGVQGKDSNSYRVALNRAGRLGVMKLPEGMTTARGVVVDGAQAIMPPDTQTGKGEILSATTFKDVVMKPQLQISWLQAIQMRTLNYCKQILAVAIRVESNTPDSKGAIELRTIFGATEDKVILLDLKNFRFRADHDPKKVTNKKTYKTV